MWGFFRRGRSPTFFLRKTLLGSMVAWLRRSGVADAVSCLFCSVLQTRLICIANKASLCRKQGFFALQTRLLFKRI